VANGKVFVATYGEDEPRSIYPDNPARHPTTFPARYYVAVYGLLDAPAPVRPVVNQDRDDVTVVRATTTPALALPTSQCAPLDAGSVDCTDALAQSAGAPALHRIVVAADQDLSSCSLLRVTTVGKDAAVANASGIGFWSAQAKDGNQTPEDSGRFVPASQLKAVGRATLANGTAATLHEFVGVANCPSGDSSSFARLFKPYMQFDGAADGRIFRNWDLSPNYSVSLGAPQFDRAAVVLRP
jgi:hypothetical protein